MKTQFKIAFLAIVLCNLMHSSFARDDDFLRRDSRERERDFGEREFGEREFGEREFGERDFGERPFAEHVDRAFEQVGGETGDFFTKEFDENPSIVCSCNKDLCDDDDAYVGLQTLQDTHHDAVISACKGGDNPGNCHCYDTTR